jgi:hypothetical protein
MTQQQYERLPELLRAIVDIDRELAELQARVITPFNRIERPVRELELIGRRAGLRHAATQRWGHTARGGPVTA